MKNNLLVIMVLLSVLSTMVMIHDLMKLIFSTDYPYWMNW